MTQNVDAITVVTYNLWGIFNSKHRAARMAHFATKVSRYDVMLLQEQFSEEDFNIIIRSLPQELQESRHFRRFPSAFYGSGIAVISRFPISSALFYTFPLQGSPERILHGDYYANKGAALVRVNVPARSTGAAAESYREVLLYSTHLVAVYEKSARLLDWRHELYLTARLSQAISMADFVAETSKPTDFVIIAGDFNCSQSSLELRTMLVLLRRRGYQFDSVIPATSTAHYTTMTPNEHALLTYSHENVFNSMEEGWPVQGGDVPLQIDHMFLSSNTIVLRPYEDCPDAPPQYPFFNEVENQTLPAGVVVFKANEVRVPARLSLRAKFARWALLRGMGWNLNGLVTLASWIAPQGTSCDTDPSVELVPMSDHYGVAARIDLREDQERPKDVEANPVVALTELEEHIMHESTLFLDHSVQRLHFESRLCLGCAAISAAIVIGNLLLLAYNARARQEYTARVLEQLHTLSTLRATVTSRMVTQEDVTQNTFLNWLKDTLLYTVLKQPRQPLYEEPSVDAEQLDYTQIAARIHSVGALEAIHPIVTIVGSLVCLGSLVIGVLQRRADANCVEEQVRRLKREGF